MPIYIIHCLDCGNVTEEFFPTVDVTKWRCKNIVSCPDLKGHQECGSDKKEKLPARSSFRLHNIKTTGFTKTSSITPSAG
jgi:hypothetical protein